MSVALRGSSSVNSADPRPSTRAGASESVMPDTRWPAARRVLAVRLDSLGPVMMTTPALRALRDSVHDRHVTLLTSSAGSKLAPLLACVDDVIAYDAPWMKTQRADASVDGDVDMIATLRRGRFDAAVIFTVFSQN